MTATTEAKHSALPYSRVFVGFGDPVDEQEELLEFRLLYEGTLLSSGNRGAIENQHEIRQVLNPQLRRQWWNHGGLRQKAMHCGNSADPRKDATEQERFDAGVRAIAKEWGKCDFSFVPMMTHEDKWRCSLDVLLLRPEGEQTVIGPDGPTEHKFIFNRGDIDGQLKTVFDALQFPQDPSVIRDFSPQDDEKPLFCLLANDRLISEVRLTADPLLLLPRHTTAKATDSYVLIHVKINAMYPGAFGTWGV